MPPSMQMFSPVRKPAFWGAEVEDHIGNVQRIAHPARRLLDRVRAFPDGVPGVDPPGEMEFTRTFPDRLTARAWVRADIRLGRRVAFGLGLAHPVPEEEMFTMDAPGAKWGANSLAR